MTTIELSPDQLREVMYSLYLRKFKHESVLETTNLDPVYRDLEQKFLDSVNATIESIRQQTKY